HDPVGGAARAGHRAEGRRGADAGVHGDHARVEGPSAGETGLARRQQPIPHHLVRDGLRQLRDERVEPRRIERPRYAGPYELVLLEGVDQRLDGHDAVDGQVAGLVYAPPAPAPVAAPEAAVVRISVPVARLVAVLGLATHDAHDDDPGEAELLELGLGLI